MKVSDVETLLRKKSTSSIIYLFIPYLNYLFPIFQLRAAYNSALNFFLENGRVPGILATLGLALRFALYGSLASAVLLAGVLWMGWNPLGPVFECFLDGLADVLAGTLSPEHSAFLFLKLRYYAGMDSLTSDSFRAIAGITALSYLIFALVGSFWARGVLAEYSRNRAPA